MSSRVYEIQGYAIALPHVLFISAVFSADEEGWQFNVRFSGEMRLSFKYPTRTDATVARELFIKALRDCP